MIRAGMLKLGGGMPGQLLAADPGHRGPRVPCGQGHEAEFVACRDKIIDTVPGPVTLTRAWYHCAACGHGLAPRDAELGVAGTSMSPGLTAMNDRAASAASRPISAHACALIASQSPLFHPPERRAHPCRALAWPRRSSRSPPRSAR